MPELTQAARDLYAIGEKIHKDLRRRFMLPVWLAIGVGAALVLAGYLYVNNRIEANSRGLRVTVATQQKIIDAQQVQIVADCPQNKALGEADILPQTTKFGRDIVEYNRRAYEIKCLGRDHFGPLKPADPDLARPIQPSPSP